MPKSIDYVEELDWKISNDNRAWAYVSDNLQKNLIQSKELSQHIRKAANVPLVVSSGTFQSKNDTMLADNRQLADTGISSAQLVKNSEIEKL